MMSTIPDRVNDLFVDFKSLKPYMQIGTIKKSNSFSRYCVDNVDLWIDGPDTNRLIKNSDGSTDYLDYQSEVFREKALLLKLPYNDVNNKELYIDLGNLNFDLSFMMRKKVPLSTVAYKKNSLFVDEKTLELYNNEEQKDFCPTRKYIDGGIRKYDGYLGDPLWNQPENESVYYNSALDRQFVVPSRSLNEIKRELGLTKKEK